MIRKIQAVLFIRRKPVRDNHREFIRDNHRAFNGELLDRHRNDVFVLMHHQMRGLN